MKHKQSHQDHHVLAQDEFDELTLDDSEVPTESKAKVVTA